MRETRFFAVNCFGMESAENVDFVQKMRYQIVIQI